MIRAYVMVGLSLMAGSAAMAEPNALLDTGGRVIATGAAKVASPCAGAVALPVEAAKALVLRIATEEKFFPEFVLSVAKIESRYASTALSERGAFGLMQLTPDTARRFEVDLCNPEGNVRGGVRFLRVLHERYRNPLFILAAYNAGEDAVRKSRGVPPFPETVRFVADVLNDFYTWPAAVASSGPRPPAKVASATLPDIVEIEATGPAPIAAVGEPVTTTKGTGARSTTTSAAASRWNDGFVMHVD